MIKYTLFCILIALVTITRDTLPFSHEEAEHSQKFILMTMLYNESDKVRRKEYLACLSRNLAHPAIDHIHIFYDTTKRSYSDPFFDYLTSLPVTITPIAGRVTFGELFTIATQWYNHHRIIVCNADIFFDETLNLLAKIDFNNLFIALTRWDIHKNGSANPRGALWNPLTKQWVHKELQGSGSQDAWLFQAPINHFENDMIEMGTLWCDPLIAYQAKKAGMHVINPCLSVKAFHLHLSNIRHDQGSNKPNQPYLFLPFSTLEE